MDARSISNDVPSWTRDEYIVADMLLKLGEYTGSNAETNQMGENIEEGNQQHIFIQSLTVFSDEYWKLFQSILSGSESLTGRGPVNKASDPSDKSCTICGAHAVSKHYGVRSCHACKYFFRRCTLQQTTLRCISSSHCSITKTTRAFCGACRYRKCIQCGMKPSAVGTMSYPRFLNIESRLMIIFDE